MHTCTRVACLSGAGQNTHRTHTHATHTDAWHARLVRYYSFFGFEPVCTVGGKGLADIPHMLVWGGEGTRMDADVAAMLRKWGPLLRRGLS